jgi:hypothetical protein
MVVEDGRSDRKNAAIGPLCSRGHFWMFHSNRISDCMIVQFIHQHD